LNLRRVLKKVARKLVGWGIIIFSAFSFPTSVVFLARGDIFTGFYAILIATVLAVLGWSIQTDLEKPRERINAVFVRYFPKCPICKSDKGYKIHGLLPSSQYVQCLNCGAEWTSTDFIGFKDLKSMKLWKPPSNPQVYAEFISQSPLRLSKSYPTILWQAMMNNQEVSLDKESVEKVPLLTNIKTIRLIDLISSHKRCCGISLGGSLALTAIGFFGLGIPKENSYILFVTTFLAIFVLLIEMRRL
jgi:hypothetical protein